MINVLGFWFFVLKKEIIIFGEKVMLVVVGMVFVWGLVGVLVFGNFYR